MSLCPFCSTAIQTTDTTCSSCGASLVTHDWALPVGTTLGKYRLEQVLGQGGFGITYLALDTQLNRHFAVKELFPEGSSRTNNQVIPPSSMSAPGFLETKARFLTEAQALAKFSHPNIVRVFEVFEDNSTAYLVMEALSGETLGQRLLRGALDPFEVKQLGVELAQALEVVHTAGLLHRDIKPDNIFLSQDRVVLLDFGSARAFAKGKVQKHTRLVTPGYAAPEQYATEAQFAAYTDVYGMAATLYHALVGAAPPPAVDRMLGKRLLQLPKSELGNVIANGMEIAVQQRPSTVAAFVGLLEQASETLVEPQIKPPKPVLSSTPSPSQPKPKKPFNLGVSFLTFLVVLLLYFIAGVLDRVGSNPRQEDQSNITAKRESVQEYAMRVRATYLVDGLLSDNIFVEGKEVDCLNRNSFSARDFILEKPSENIISCRASLVNGVLSVVVTDANGEMSINGF